jgi:hypothetical protein
MECDRFLEEKLSGTESPEFREHLAACGGCRRDLEEYDEVRQLYREASTERCPRAVPRLRRSRSLAWMPAAAAAVFLVGALLLMLFGGPGEERGKAPEKETASGIFFRVHLSPWDGEESRLDGEMDDLWKRIGSLERRKR